MPNTQPNILFIMSDQWSVRLIDDAIAGRGPKTPNIVRLARRGMRFSQCYTPFPVCMPARASMFTASMPTQTHVVGNGSYDIPASLPRLAETFKQAGYELAYFGKDHSGGVVRETFTNFGSKQFDSAGYLADGNLLDPVFTRDTIQFLKNERRQPFFLTYSLINPHDICMTPPMVETPNRSVANITDAFRWDLTYLRGEDLPELSPNHQDTVPDVMEHYRKNAYAPEWDENKWRCFLAAYWLMVENADAQIGQVLDTLEETGQAENTIIMFTTDHGDQAGSHGRIGKGYLYEESARIPLLLSWPGHVPEDYTDNRHPISGCDLLPTLLDLAGLEVPEAYGKSFKTIIDAPDSCSFREYAAAETFDGRMVRFDAFKYIRYEDADNNATEYLFDIEADPYEMQNLIEDQAHSAVAEKARQYLQDYYQQVGGDIQTTLAWQK